MPLAPGRRNQGEFGIQQALGKWAVADFGYFIKRTTNAYDFGVLFDTPIVFPISWDHSKIDGFTGRVNLVEHGGFSAFVVMAHTNAIFSGPATAVSSSILASSGSTTTRSSIQRSTCSRRSTRSTACGARSAGGTTRAWSRARCPISRPR